MKTVDSPVIPRVIELMSLGDLAEARAIADKAGLAEIVRNIDGSQAHIRDKKKYIDTYSSDAPFNRPRTAGEFHFQHASSRLTQVSQFILMDLKFRASEVLDVGCADGSFLLQIWQSIGRGTGIDLWSSGIKAAEAACLERGIRNLRFIEGSFEEAKLDRKFSAIVCGEILEHCIDPETILAKCRDHLLDNGIVIVTVPLKPPAKELENREFLLGPGLKEHVRYVDERRLCEYACKAGLSELLSIKVKENGWICLISVLKNSA